MNIFLEDFIQAEIFLSGRYFFREEIPFEKRFLSRRDFFQEDISFEMTFLLERFLLDLTLGRGVNGQSGELSTQILAR